MGKSKKQINKNPPAVELQEDEPFELVIGIAIKDNRLQVASTTRTKLPADFVQLQNLEAETETKEAVNE